MTSRSLRGVTMEKLFDVVHEDAGLLVINKPAGLVCHPTKGDAYSSLISRVRIYLAKADDTASAHLVNRLDRETSGLVLVAKNPETAGQLGTIWETRAVEKEYAAIVHGHVREEHGVIDAPLGKDETSVVAIKDAVRADGAAAQTEFHVERRFARDGREFSWLRVLPRTGRKHQIRIHLAHHGHPIVGDKIYGGDETRYLKFIVDALTPDDWNELLLPNQALHAGALRFLWRGVEREFRAAPESGFVQFAEPVWRETGTKPKETTNGHE